MKFKIFTFLTFIILLSTKTVSASCPSMCKCSDNLLSCKSEFLEDVPNFDSLEVEPEAIDLSGNSIFSIAAADFSFDGNENVKYLYLNNNHIVDIQENAFSELKNLRELSLNMNSLDSVPSMFVADNTELVSLDLSNNFFDLTTPEIYSESLEVLDLSSTKISRFEEANIKYLPNLKVINLSYNRIQSIEATIFENLPNLLVVDLTGNFWECNQKTIDLFNFLTDKGLTDVTEPVKCITEDGFYQDIYTSSGPVDIFSISLEGLNDNQEQEKVDETNNQEELEEPDALKGNVATEDENKGGEENFYEETNNDEEDQYVNDEGLQDDNQEAANSEDNNNKNLGDLTDDTLDKLVVETPQNDEELDGNEKTLDDKSLEEVILKQTGKNNVEDITDTDVIDAINQLMKEKETHDDFDDYGDDYWENDDNDYVKPKIDEEEIKEKEEGDVEQAKKVIEEEEKKENGEAVAETSDDSSDMGISVIREDQYIVLLARDSSDDSQYTVYFKNNVVYTLGIMAFVLMFFVGIFFGLYAIREAYTRKRRREIHGSTNVLIGKWSQDLA